MSDVRYPLANAAQIGLRKSAQIPSDMRSAALCLLSTLPIPLLMQFMYPRVYSLHDMPDDAGLSDPATGEIVLPPTIAASSASLVPYGLYLIDDGQTQFLWLGRDTVPQLLEDVFGQGDRAGLRTGKTSLPVLENDFNERVRAVVEKARDYRGRGVGSITVPHLYLVREDGDPALRLWAQTMLVEDRGDQSPSLQQWLGMMREKVRASLASMASSSVPRAARSTQDRLTFLACRSCNDRPRTRGPDSCMNST